MTHATSNTTRVARALDDIEDATKLLGSARRTLIDSGQQDVHLVDMYTAGRDLTELTLQLNEIVGQFHQLARGFAQERQLRDDTTQAAQSDVSVKVVTPDERMNSAVEALLACKHSLANAHQAAAAYRATFAQLAVEERPSRARVGDTEES